MVIDSRRLKNDISISSSGDNVIINAPQTGQFIVIDHINILCVGTAVIQFKDGANSYGGAYTMQAGQAMVLENTSYDPEGVITCSVGNSFIINTNNTNQVSGFVRYRVINL